MTEVKRGLHNVLRRRFKSRIGVSVYLTTTPTIEGKPITRYCGVVAGEAILGTNIFRDMLADIRDIVGGRSATYERALREARKIALDELQQQARALGANAVVGIDLDYETVGTGMLMVSASGTAVRVSGLDPAAPAGSFARAQIKGRKDAG